MPATHGFAASFRKRGRLIGCCTALALMLCAALLAPPRASATIPTTTYLALGPENTFGYQQQRFEENQPNEAPSYFNKNYPAFFAKKLRATVEADKNLVVVNDGCPGETTDSFFGTGPIGTNFDPTATPACPYHFAKGLPLHNSLGTLSQLEDALEVLNPCFVHSGVCPPNHEVKAVTLDIGGNDELASLGKCLAEVKAEFEATGTSQYGTHVEESIKVCVLHHLEEVYEHIYKNVATAIGLIRNASLGNYSGPIVYLGFFNPFTFVLTGSDVLQKVVNAELESKLAASGLGVKYANPLIKFNTEVTASLAEEKRIGCTQAITELKEEQTNKAKCKVARLGLLVEEGNVHDEEVNKAAAEAQGVTEAGEGKTVIYPYNGSADLHPTVKGHEVLANVIFANYP